MLLFFKIIESFCDDNNIKIEFSSALFEQIF